MRILLDTNMLLRMVYPASSHHTAAVTATQPLSDRGDSLHIVPQTLYEFRAVATRPVDANGLGFSPTAASVRHDAFVELFTLLRDERTIFDHWRNLVADHSVLGVRVHDARLAAAMIRHILTFNGRDFVRHTEITVIDPEAVS